MDVFEVAAKLLASWPIWKRNILIDSSKQFKKIARKVIVNK